MNVPLYQDQTGQPYGNSQAGYPTNQQGGIGNIAMNQVMDSDLAKKLNLDKSAHPVACLATFVFKAAAAVLYLFFGMLLDDYVDCFIACVVMSAIDFWVVKNITGRLLVGLRWWSIIQEDGTEKWIFESRENEYKPNPVDKYLFWTSQLLAIAFWGVLFVLGLLSFGFSYCVIKGICLLLVGTNLYCFYKCSGEQQAKLKNLGGSLGNQMAQTALDTALKSAMGGK